MKVTLTGRQVGHGHARPSLSTCSTDSRQDYVSTDSRGPRARPPRRAAAAAALEHSHLIFGSPSPGGITDASPSPLVRIHNATIECLAYHRMSVARVLEQQDGRRVKQ